MEGEGAVGPGKQAELERGKTEGKRGSKGRELRMEKEDTGREGEGKGTECGRALSERLSSSFTSPQYLKFKLVL